MTNLNKLRKRYFAHNPEFYVRQYNEERLMVKYVHLSVRWLIFSAYNTV
jgi:hypothetical protein